MGSAYEDNASWFYSRFVQTLQTQARPQLAIPRQNSFAVARHFSFRCQIDQPGILFEKPAINETVSRCACQPGRFQGPVELACKGSAELQSQRTRMHESTLASSRTHDS